jgi:hypothetical protein
MLLRGILFPPLVNRVDVELVIPDVVVNGEDVIPEERGPKPLAGCGIYNDTTYFLVAFQRLPKLLVGAIRLKQISIFGSGDFGDHRTSFVEKRKDAVSLASRLF